ncbi:MAG: DegT/DnrJ/EryC1/StrS family aminotransferase, partial [Deltaproteobacteria bacterium]|nr:DegT/DnrJ/EryC1/StrS family aminotransferase [Deltaproteobacteria bacterium]
PNVKALEDEVAKYSDVSYGIGVASGSDALMVALMALDVAPGDKVITTPYTFFATAGAISVLGAVPVFVDIDPVTYNMNPVALARVLRKSRKGVKAIMPVHLYGQSADMAGINRTAKKYGIPVVEDAAQSIGAEYKGKRVGSLGDIACYSFYPTKNLGCFGDGGMIVTKKKSLADKVRKLRVHGSGKRYYHDLIGINSRLDELQAAVLRVKLKKLNKWTKARQRNARNYDRLFKDFELAGCCVELPLIGKEYKSIYNQYVIRTQKRDKLRSFLAKNDIGSEIYYPLGLHEQKCYKELGYKKGDFPETEKAAKETLALPIYPALTLKQQQYVVEKISEFYCS